MNMENRYLQLFEQSALGIALIEIKTGKFLEINKSFENILLYKKNELTQLSFFNLFSINQKEIKKSLQIEKILPRKDKIKIHVRISFLLEENEQNAIWIQIEDITKQKELEIIYEDNKNLLEYIAIESSLSKSLEKIVYLAEKRNPEIKCSILLLDESKKHLLSTTGPSLPDFYNEAINGVEIGEKVGSCGSAAFKKQRIIVENINTHENWQPYLELTQKANLNSCWSEPIISSNNEVLGTFAIYNSKPKSPSDFDIKLISSYANLASKAIEKFQYNEELEKSKQKLEYLFENSQVGLMYISGQRVILKANLEAKRILGFTEKEIIGKSVRKLHLSQKYFNEFGKKFKKILNKNKTFTLEYPLKRKDGNLIWCELSGKSLDTSDLNKGILWTIKDISLRKEYEHKLKYSELLNKNILSAIPQLIWLKDKDGVYITCNEEFEKFFGAKEEEIVGKTDYDFVDKELADFFRMHDKNAMKSSSIVTNEEVVKYATTGEEHLLETSKQSLKDQHGNIIGVLGLGYDVTDRKKREEELTKLNSLAQELTEYQKILLSIFEKGDSVLFNWKKEDDWNIEYVSASVERILGYSTIDFLSKKVHYNPCIYEKDRQRVEDEVQNMIEGDFEYFKHEPYRLLTKDDEQKWVLDYGIVRKDHKGKVTNYIRYITDITEQIKNQEILYHQSKIAAMGEMLGNISHQWRQPLSAISTLVTGIKLKNEINLLTKDEINSDMDVVNNHAQYLSRTIDDFRHFFSKDTNIKKPIDLKYSLGTTYSLVKDSLNSSNILTVISTENAPKVCNENIFVQAMINIFNNARDALNANKTLNKKYIFVDLKIKDDYYLLTIKDNAGGIDEKIIDKIFEPYFTTKHQSQGTGIGLYMTNQIITKHLNGKILAKNETYTFKNKEYTGACFEIKLSI